MRMVAPGSARFSRVEGLELNDLRSGTGTTEMTAKSATVVVRHGGGDAELITGVRANRADFDLAGGVYIVSLRAILTGARTVAQSVISFDVRRASDNSTIGVGGGSTLPSGEHEKTYKAIVYLSAKTTINLAIDRTGRASSIKSVSAEFVRLSDDSHATLPTINSDIGEIKKDVAALKRNFESNDDLIAYSGQASSVPSAIKLIDWRGSAETNPVSLSRATLLGNSRFISGISRDPTDNQYYALDINGDRGHDSALYLFDPETGDLQRQGSANIFGLGTLGNANTSTAHTTEMRGLEITPSGIAYAGLLSENAAGNKTFSSIVTLNLGTGAAIDVVHQVDTSDTSVADSSYYSVIYDASTGELLAMDADAMYRIDLRTGERLKLNSNAISETANVKMQYAIYNYFWGEIVGIGSDNRLRIWDRGSLKFERLHNNQLTIRGGTVLYFDHQDNLFGRIIENEIENTEKINSLNLIGRAEIIRMQGVGIGTVDEELTPIAANPLGPAAGQSGPLRLLSDVRGNDFTVKSGTYVCEIHVTRVDPSAADSPMWFVIRRASDNGAIFTTTRNHYHNPQSAGTGPGNFICTANFAADTRVNVQCNREEGHSISASGISIKFTRIS